MVNDSVVPDYPCTIGPFRRAQRSMGLATLRRERLDWIAPRRKIGEAVQREIERFGFRIYRRNEGPEKSNASRRRDLRGLIGDCPPVRLTRLTSPLSSLLGGCLFWTAPAERRDSDPEAATVLSVPDCSGPRRGCTQLTTHLPHHHHSPAACRS